MTTPFTSATLVEELVVVSAAAVVSVPPSVTSSRSGFTVPTAPKVVVSTALFSMRSVLRELFVIVSVPVLSVVGVPVLPRMIRLMPLKVSGPLVGRGSFVA